jgi:chromosome segregation ATPase
MTKKAEENTKHRYMGYLEKKKEREKLLDERCESLTREIDTLDRQVKELEEKTSGYMHQVAESEKVIEKLRYDNEKLTRLLDAAGNRLP